MGAEFVSQCIVALRVAPGEQALAEQFHPHRRAFVRRQFFDQEGRLPAQPEHPAHRGARAGLAEEIVLFFAEHRMVPNVRRHVAPRGGIIQALSARQPTLFDKRRPSSQFFTVHSLGRGTV